MSVPSPHQVNTSIFGMASAVFTSVCAALVTTAVKGNSLIDKTANTLIHGVSAAENVAEAVERRSKIYGDGIVRNGELAERETTLKYRLRLHNLEKQEKDVLAGLADYTPEPTMKDKLQKAMEAATASVLGSDTVQAVKSAQSGPAIRSSADRARQEAQASANA
jgi:hypothetical protein